MTERDLIRVDPAGLLAIRDALVMQDVDEAYHQLRLLADADCAIALATGEHWTEWERAAFHNGEIAARDGNNG
jgi:hypothetical protein